MPWAARCSFSRLSFPSVLVSSRWSDRDCTCDSADEACIMFQRSLVTDANSSVKDEPAPLCPLSRLCRGEVFVLVAGCSHREMTAFSGIKEGGIQPFAIDKSASFIVLRAPRAAA